MAEEDASRGFRLGGSSSHSSSDSSGRTLPAHVADSVPVVAERSSCEGPVGFQRPKCSKEGEEDLML